MADLKALLEELRFDDVETYIQSGNAFVRSRLNAAAIARKIEDALSDAFRDRGADCLFAARRS